MRRGGRGAPPIYVEAHIHSTMEDVWGKTQDPELHERWDIRFTSIRYLQKTENEKGQRFEYTRRFGPFTIAGIGETVGERRQADGTATSALKFWSDDPRSLIREGTGYWRYVPTINGIRFLTRYDYDVRFGPVGRWLDRLVWRPLMGWGTAWSFDRLRLWLEEDVTPESSLTAAVARYTSRCALAATWIYQGLVPKLLVRDRGELDILKRIRVLRGKEAPVLVIAGVAETALGLMMIARPRVRVSDSITLLALPVLAAGAWRGDRKIFVAPFNPVALTIAMMGLAVTDYVSSRITPSATNCLREPPRDEA